MAKHKILVVDDEEDITNTVAIMLRSRGFDVVTAYEGSDGFAKAKSEHPDIILIDIMMPVMDGFETCIKLKSNKETQKIPIIMFSANGENAAVTKANKVGAEDFVVKPFNLPVLVSKLNRLLAKRNK